jgi:hypothetical protein
VNTTEIVGALMLSVTIFFLGVRFLYREPQYTGLSWLVLAGLILNTVGLGEILINS